MHLDADKIKLSLTEEEINLILNNLGSKNPLQGNQYQTVCHGGHKHKLYYYHDSKSFHCYTDCSENMSIFEVVIRAKKQQGYKYSFPQAVKLVAELTGKTFGFGNAIQRDQSDIVDDWDWLNKFKKEDKINTELPEYNDKVLDVFLPYPHEEWLDEGISYSTIRKFEIGYYLREEKISMVHRDIDGRFVGLRGRATRKEDVEDGRKYMPISIENKLYNHMTMMNLYGLDKTKDAVKKLKKIVFFEGEKSVLKCQDFYGDLNFTSAVCSSNISNFHRDIALSLGVEEVFIAFDKFREKEFGETDEKYTERIIEYQEKLIKFARKFTSYCKAYILWDNEGLLDYRDSPADKGKEILEKLMMNKIEIKTGGEDDQD